MDHYLSVDNEGKVTLVTDGGDISMRIVGEEKISVTEKEAEQVREAQEDSLKTVKYNKKTQKLVFKKLGKNIPDL